LHESNDSCRFSFTHNGFDEKWEGSPPYVMTKEGWEHFMQSLKNYCESGKGQPWG
jgi:hypothetical protein